MNQLGLFAKFWQPGRVKTRLAASIGDQSACDVYQAFMSHLINRLHDSADQRTVVFTPRDRESDFRKSIPMNWKLCPQSDGDLGTRLSSYFREAFETDPTIAPQDNGLEKKVVVIGADCPQIAPGQIEKAFELLDQVPVVIGPSTDGGYYLIAMKQKCFDVFEDIPWSTETVFSSTVKRLQNEQVQFLTLPPLTDVDDLESMMTLKTELEIQVSSASGTGEIHELRRKLLEQLRIALSGPAVEPE